MYYILLTRRRVGAGGALHDGVLEGESDARMLGAAGPLRRLAHDHGTPPLSHACVCDRAREREEGGGLGDRREGRWGRALQTNGADVASR
jgi:hypothetical protein